MKHTLKKLSCAALLSVIGLVAHAVPDPAVLGGTISPTPALWPRITPEQYQTFSFQINNNGSSTTSNRITVQIQLTNLDFGEAFDANTHISHTAGITPFTWSYQSGTKILTGVLAGTFAGIPSLDNANTFTINRLIVQSASASPLNTVGGEVKIVITGSGASVNSSTSNDDTDSKTFTSSTIRGTVWADADGSAVINGGELPVTSGVWANLVDETNMVRSSVQVDALGQFAFNLVSPSTPYKVILTSSDQTGNTNLTASNLPGAYQHMGTNQEGTANAANRTGIANVTTGIDVNFLAQNFGIERPPTAVANVNAVYSEIIENTKYALSIAEGQTPLSGSDPEQGAMGTGKTFVITGTLPANAKLYYNGVQITQADVTAGTGTAVISNYNDNLLEFSVDNSSTSSVVFTYLVRDAAGLSSPSGTYSISGLSILPVTGLSLKAHVESSKPVLQWVTVTEQNTSHFDIERSYDGTSYAKIGSVAAAGNSNTKSNYSLVDNTASSAKVIYYRVRLNDKNGKAVVSNVVPLSFGKSAISIYPSPATSHLFVSGALAGSKLAVMGIDGKVIRQSLANGSGADKLDVSALAAGTYMLQVTATDGSIVINKFVKTK